MSSIIFKLISYLILKMIYKIKNIYIYGGGGDVRVSFAINFILRSVSNYIYMGFNTTIIIILRHLKAYNILCGIFQMWFFILLRRSKHYIAGFYIMLFFYRLSLKIRYHLEKLSTWEMK